MNLKLYSGLNKVRVYNRDLSLEFGGKFIKPIIFLLCFIVMCLVIAPLLGLNSKQNFQNLNSMK